MDAFLATMQQVLDYLHTIKITDLIDIAIFPISFIESFCSPKKPAPVRCCVALAW